MTVMENPMFLPVDIWHVAFSINLNVLLLVDIMDTTGDLLGISLMDLSKRPRRRLNSAWRF